MARLSHGAAALVLLLATGARAADAPPEPVPAELAGTWRWVSFMSPKEKLVVDKPEQYLLSFPEPAHIALKADCNRAAGGVGFGKNGAMKVSPMAMTKAMCPPGSLGDRFAFEVGRATHWSKRGQDLMLELPAYSGTLRFTRQP